MCTPLLNGYLVLHHNWVRCDTRKAFITAIKGLMRYIKNEFGTVSSVISFSDSSWYRFNENNKLPIATPRSAFLPKIIVNAAAKPIVGKNGIKLICPLNSNLDRVANKKYNTAVKPTILGVELRYVVML